MITASYLCSQCHAAVTQVLDTTTPAITCPHCNQTIEYASECIAEGALKQCLVCPSKELFIRKDFPQRLGVALVAVGVIGSSIAWYYANLFWTFGILFGTALADFLLFAIVGNALMCYRCGALFRGADHMDAHGPFDLETHEKYRQMEARLRSPS